MPSFSADTMSAIGSSRRFATGSQVVRQLWIVHPGVEANIFCEDPDISFGQRGVSCGINETVTGVIAGRPESGMLESFAEGTLRFFQGIGLLSLPIEHSGHEEG